MTGLVANPARTGEPIAGRRAYRYSIPSARRIAVKAACALPNRSSPEKPPSELVVPRCGSNEK